MSQDADASQVSQPGPDVLVQYGAEAPVTDQGIIELEMGTADPIHQQAFQASLQTRCAFILEHDVIRGYDGRIVYAKVPIGYPQWKYWSRMPRSHTYRCVDEERGLLWLFRFLTFKKEKLTPAIMHASEPWLYQEPAVATASTRTRPLTQAPDCVSILEDVITWPGGREQVVILPVDYPAWNTWKVVPGTETFQAIELAAGNICLYRQSTFQKKPLTQAILEVHDPWFHQEMAPLPPVSSILPPKTTSE